MERPPILGTGTIVEERDRGRLYRVEMKNGHVAFAVVPLDGPPPPPGDEVLGHAVEVGFSPYDMSRCKIRGWPSETVSCG